MSSVTIISTSNSVKHTCFVTLLYVEEGKIQYYILLVQECSMTVAVRFSGKIVPGMVLSLALYQGFSI
jgi:hypothetical protein